MAITGVLTADFSDFETAAKKAEASLKGMEGGAQKVEAALSDISTGGKKASDQLDKLGSSVSGFGKVLAGVFTAQKVISFAKEIIADVDRIDTAAKRLGASSTHFQQFSYAIEQSGGNAEQATAGIVLLTDKLANNDKGLLGVLRKLNIDLETFSNTDAVVRFTQLGTAIAGVEDPAERLELRLEAMGTKGEKALAAIDDKFRELSENAPVYSAESIAALEAMGDSFDDLWMRVKIGAAESALAIKDFLDWRKTMMLDEHGAPKFFGGTGDVKDNPTPKAPNNLPAGLGPAPLDPNDPKALALAMGNLSREAETLAAKNKRLADETKAAKEQFDSMNWVLKMLKMEVGNTASAMGPLMDAFGVSTKVDQFAQRIINLANRSAELRREQERLLELISPGSSKLSGDDTDAQIHELRSDSRNWQGGNLTPQALDIEARLLDIANLRNVAAKMAPVPVPSAGGFGAQFPGGFSPGVTNITVNAQGSWLDTPDRMNQLARQIEDNIAKRSGLTNTYSRRGH